MDNQTEILRNLVYQVLSTGEISKNWLERARLALKEPHPGAQRCIRCGHHRYFHDQTESHPFAEAEKTAGEHTVWEDFDHFLSYSGNHSQPEGTLAKMWVAFYAAWSPTPTQLPEETFAKVVEAYTREFGALDDLRNFAFFRYGWHTAEEHYNRLLKNK